VNLTIKSLVALVFAISVAGFASQASAEKISAKRVAAIEKCSAAAMVRYPDPDPRWHHGRYLAYEECMTDAGEAP
jgi:hypothetical protein